MKLVGVLLVIIGIIRLFSKKPVNVSLDNSNQANNIVGSKLGLFIAITQILLGVSLIFIL